jgi:hypothetical protein
MPGRPVRVPRHDPAIINRQARCGSDPGNGGGILRRTAGTRAAPMREVMTEPELHHEFVPALTDTEAGTIDWYWTLTVTDDTGTPYSDDNGGTFARSTAAAASHGTRDLGGQIPPQARRLTIRSAPAPGWIPPGPWRRSIDIDLSQRRLLD